MSHAAPAPMPLPSLDDSLAAPTRESVPPLAFPPRAAMPLACPSRAYKPTHGGYPEPRCASSR